MATAGKVRGEGTDSEWESEDGGGSDYVMTSEDSSESDFDEDSPPPPPPSAKKALKKKVPPPPLPRSKKVLRKKVSPPPPRAKMALRKKVPPPPQNVDDEQPPPQSDGGTKEGERSEEILEASDSEWESDGEGESDPEWEWPESEESESEGEEMETESEEEVVEEPKVPFKFPPGRRGIIVRDLGLGKNGDLPLQPPPPQAPSAQPALPPSTSPPSILPPVPSSSSQPPPQLPSSSVPRTKRHYTHRDGAPKSELDGLTFRQRYNLKKDEESFNNYLKLYAEGKVKNFPEYRNLVAPPTSTPDGPIQGKKRRFLLKGRVAEKKTRDQYVTPPTRAGRPKHEPTYNDGLHERQRNRLRERREYGWYMHLHEKGKVTCLADFREEKSKFLTEFSHMSGVRTHSELTPGKRIYRLLKERHEMLVARGVPPEETTWSKMKACKRKWHTDPAHTVCLHCNARFGWRVSVRQHVKRCHVYCASLLEPLSEEERGRIEEITRKGAKSKEGRSARRARITGIRAGTIFHRKRANPHKLVHGFMQTSGRGYHSAAMDRGIRLEPVAVKRYQEQNPTASIQYPVGFCIHPNNGFMGATPDALLDKDGCLEVKCPITPISQIPTRKSARFLVADDDGPRGMKLRRNDKYFDQVVMQIMCTNRQYCDFAVFFQNDDDENDWDLWVERITREEAEDHWKDMEPVLTTFYHEFMGKPYLVQDNL